MAEKENQGEKMTTMGNEVTNMVMPKKKTRNYAFDIIKGIGILLVLFGHVYPPVPYVSHFLKSFRMPLFFIVAGYFSKSYSQEYPVWANVKHYASRLIPPFLATSVITILWFVAWGGVKHDWSASLRELVSMFWADTTSLPTPWGNAYIGVTWFLLALFWAKAILLFLTQWEKWVLPISFLLSIAALLIHGIFPYSVWCFSLGLVCLPFVAIGWWCRNNKIPMWLKIVAVLAWIAAIIFSKIDIYSYSFGCYPLDVVGACGGTYVFYLLSKLVYKLDGNKWLRWLPKAFIYLGEISLAIMCVHCFEISSHFGNHLKALLGLEFSHWGMYVWRYGLTIAIAAIIVKLPFFKKIFG